MDLIRQACAAAAVLAALGGALWWLRQRGLAGLSMGRTGGRRLESLERLALGPQHSLHLVRLEQELLLVACSPSGCSMIRRLDARHTGLNAGARP